MTENEISKIIFESALKVHKVLGPGLLESAYEECLFYELKKSNLKAESASFDLWRSKTGCGVQNWYDYWG